MAKKPQARQPVVRMLGSRKTPRLTGGKGCGVDVESEFKAGHSSARIKTVSS
jgi:hypothetical protein